MNILMPNHVHAIISFVNTHQSINIIVGNGKRFMAFFLFYLNKDLYLITKIHKL